MKFGGSSVGNFEIISKVIAIVRQAISENGNIIVVVSAFQGITNYLIQMSQMASQGVNKYKSLYDEIEHRHLDIINKLISPDNQKKAQLVVRKWLDDLRDVLHGLHLVRELSPRTLDFVMSFGERLSAFIISEALLDGGTPCEFIDSRKLVKTDEQFGSAKVDFSKTNRNIKKYIKTHSLPQIVTGFIGSTSRNETTTLGRSGSDYTASIFGATLEADAIEIWTDVDGVMTADPGKVENAFTISRLSYEEAMELSHFGAKVIHPSTMQPALDKKIPIHIKNTFNPEAPGTIIHHKSNSNQYTIKGISSIDDIALINVQGSGMVGVAGVARRIFTTLAEQQINVILITQASSEHSVCFAILPADAEKARKALRYEFRYEIRDKMISEIEVQKQLTILAIVGENMRQTPGVSGKTFQALGKSGINVAAIAQGSSELNISVVISKKEVVKALNVLHDAFFTRGENVLRLFLVGTGKIGSTLLQKLYDQKKYIYDEYGFTTELIGICNTRRMIINDKGINITNWNSLLEDSGAAANLDYFIKSMIKLNLPGSIFIDCTASEEVSRKYIEILEANISIVTANKKANSGGYPIYREIKKTAQSHNVKYFYETNVGAGLPVMGTIRDLISGGDKIIRVEAVLSGTISYILNSLGDGKNFSESVREAVKKGYTEPDPRDDLDGRDVARKLLILCREIGIQMELDQIKTEKLIPDTALIAGSPEEFLQNLEQLDPEFAKRRLEAARKGRVLRYIGLIENNKAEVSLKEVDAEHPFFHLSGSDNIFAFTTLHSKDRPIVIKGPGAGSDVTAAGVLADVLRVAQYLS